MDAPELPSFDELPEKGGLRHSWGIWGPEDRLGCLNLLTPERVLAARDLVHRGTTISLDWSLGQPDPPMFGRQSYRQTIQRRSPTSQDEALHEWNTQSSSQWDGFRHVRSVAHGHYNGLPDEEHGVEHWAESGIVGRAVLADVAAWREATGRPLRQDRSDPISASDLEATLAAQGTELRPGDVLLIRTGWIAWYLRQDAGVKAHIAIRGNLVTPGLEPVEETARYLWNRHVSAVALDNPAMEVWPLGAGLAPELIEAITNDPSREHEIQLHLRLMPMLGIPVGELFYLEALAEHCRAEGRHEMMFVSSPLSLPHGVATPPNAMAIL